MTTARYPSRDGRLYIPGRDPGEWKPDQRLWLWLTSRLDGVGGDVVISADERDAMGVTDLPWLGVGSEIERILDVWRLHHLIGECRVYPTDGWGVGIRVEELPDYDPIEGPRDLPFWPADLARAWICGGGGGDWGLEFKRGDKPALKIEVDGKTVSLDDLLDFLGRDAD